MEEREREKKSLRDGEWLERAAAWDEPWPSVKYLWGIRDGIIKSLSRWTLSLSQEFCHTACSLLTLGRFGTTMRSTMTLTLIFQCYQHKWEPHLVKYVYSMMIFFIMRHLYIEWKRDGQSRRRRENERERVCETESGWKGLRHGS